MQLTQLLDQHREAIKEAWLARVLEVYPAESRRFFRQGKNAFANPVGAALAQHTSQLVDGLIEGAGCPEMCRHLEEILKIRSVQDLSPSQALGFVSLLKESVRRQLGDTLQQKALRQEWETFQESIDQLQLRAFDIYVKCRERIYELRIQEIKRTGFRLLQRANLLAEEGGETEYFEVGGA
jgi:hypothetical protein